MRERERGRRRKSRQDITRHDISRRDGHDKNARGREQRMFVSSLCHNIGQGKTGDKNDNERQDFSRKKKKDEDRGGGKTTATPKS
jgi:hypothetical protein